MSKHHCALCGEELSVAGRAGRAGRICGTCLEREQLAHRFRRQQNERVSLGARVSDRVSAIGGSWTFVFGFLVFLALWMVFNSAVERFDPYPYILLNLGLSALAAIQAPIIMMSQNRVAQRDRAQADEDFHTNLKAELEIASLHDKLDRLTQQQLEQMLEMQRTQVALLQRLADREAPLASSLQS